MDRAIQVGAALIAPPTGSASAPVATNTAATPVTTTPSSTPIATTAAPNAKASVLSGNTVGPNIVSDFQISTNFRLYDFLRSSTGAGIPQQKMPSQSVINNIKEFCVNILEPIRAAGVQFTINSGWRCPQLNPLLPGSATNSYHMSGLAADMNPTNMNYNQMFDKIVSLNLLFYELLLESRSGSNPWVHISYEPSMNKAKKINRNFRAHN